MDLEAWRQFWGKARPASADGPRWHPLWMHALDVAAVMQALCRNAPGLIARCAGWLGWSPEALAEGLVFLAALHDLGKFTRAFQKKAPEHWPAAVLGPLDDATAAARDPGHPQTGLHILLAELVEPLARWLPDWSEDEAATLLLGTILGHHGRPPAPPEGTLPKSVCRTVEVQAAQAFVAMVDGLLPAPAWPPPNEAGLGRASWLLAGLMVLADWIGSDQRWFPYRADPVEPAAYWCDWAVPRADLALADAGLRPRAPSPVTGFRAVTGLAMTPSPVQAWAEAVALPDGPVLAIIEDMTGSGKTEAALILAHRLMA